MDIRQLLLLYSAGKIAYLIYDSFTRANADALGSTESKGPNGRTRRRLSWTTIGGDFDIVSGKVVGGDAQDSKVLNPGFETGGTGGDFDGGAEADDGASDTFNSWTNQSVNDANGNKVEATTTVAAGSYAIKLSYGTGFCQARQDIVGLTAGQLLYSTFWTRGDGSQEGRYGIECPNGGALLVGGNTGVSGAVYTDLKALTAVRAGETSIRAYIRNPSGVGTAYFDDFSVYVCHGAYIDGDAADVVFKAEITMPAAGADPGGLILRRSGATQWLVQLTPGLAGTDFELIELDDGTPTVRATADIDWTAATSYRIAAVLTAQSIKVYVNGTEKLSYASASIGQTNTQFGVWDGANANFSFDDVEITEYARYNHVGGY